MTDTANLPAHIREALGEKDVTQTGEMDTGTGGVPRISLKKSRFTTKEGEEEVKHGDELNVIIVGITPENHFSKTYFAGSYTPGATDAPDCQSSNGTHPDVFVDNPISENCRTCPMNAWGSAKSMSGGKAKACKDSKRVYVVLESDLEKDSPTVYLLSITVNSLKTFGAYGKSLFKAGIPSPSVVITKLSFDEEASVPKLEFAQGDFVSAGAIGPIMDVAEEKPWDAWKNDTTPKLAQPTDGSTQPDGRQPPVEGYLEDTLVQELDQWDE
ncbi:MAG: hypothetical protein DRP85_03200 [Candidatus Makaraimicrobium thalassicum]|nr:MAG: hypothetical protein DRP85_03200 [Candidatus Omnitrophota bacterium]